jgi:hypothetical protein
MKIQSFADFQKRCLERFGQQAQCTELDSGAFGVALATPEKRTGEKAMQLPGPADIRTPETTERAEGENNVIFSFSSEAPVLNYWGEPEILSHHPDDANMARFAEVGACLYNHNHSLITGKPVRVWIENAKGYCEEEFGTTATALQAKHEVLIDKTNRGISVGFVVREWVWLPGENTFYRGIKGTEDGVWVASKWDALEASHTPVPADPSVGVGRSVASDPASPVEPPESGKQRAENQNKPTIQIKEINTMNEVQKARARALGLDPETANIEQLMAAERADAAKIERGKADARRENESQIRAIAGMHSIPADMVEDAIKREISAGQFGVELAAKQREGTLPNPTAKLSKSEERDFNSFSLTRFLDGVTRGTLDGFEAEMMQEGTAECRSAGVNPQGMVLSHKIVRHLQGNQERTLTAGSAASAGNLIDTNLLSGSFVDALRNSMAVGRMGATYLTGLVGNIEIPRQTNLLTGENLAETGDTTAQDMTTDKISLSPKRIGAQVNFSKQLNMQVGNPSIEAWNRNELFNALSMKLDYDVLNGAGTSNAMLGLRNILTAIALGDNGAALDWSKVVALETAAAAANALMGNLGYLTNTKVRGALRSTLRSATAGSRFIWEGAGLEAELADYRAIASNQVPGNLTKGDADGVCSSLLFGNWNDFIIAQWGGIDFTLDTITGAGSATVKLFANQWVDCDVRHESSFAMYDDVLTS